MLEHELTESKDPVRVVVLGARGFIGAALAAHLKNVGVSVLGVTSADLDLTTDDAAGKLAERLTPEDSVVMLSALTPDKGRDITTFMRNLKMAQSVCSALETVPVQHVVHISSDAVYPFVDSDVNETSPAAPDDLFGTMHKAREVMFANAQKGPLAIVRPTLVFGSADTHNSYGPNRLRRMAKDDGKITLFGAGEETRDHIYIDDVVSLLALILSHRSLGLLNLATGTSIDFDTLARKVAGNFSPPVEVVHTDRNNPITYRQFDVTAINKAFPDFRFTPLEDGLTKAHQEMLDGA